MRKVQMEEVVLHKSTFDSMNLDTVMFYESDLSNVLFNVCLLSGVHFIKGNLDHVSFKNCKFNQSEIQALSIATFNNCSFYQTLFFLCKGELVDLGSCNFESCWFSNCDLSNVKDLTQQELNSCLGDDEVLLPAHLTRPSFWPKQADVYTWDSWLEDGEIKKSNASVDYE